MLHWSPLTIERRDITPINLFPRKLVTICNFFIFYLFFFPPLQSPKIFFIWFQTPHLRISCSNHSMGKDLKQNEKMLKIDGDMHFLWCSPCRYKKSKNLLRPRIWIMVNLLGTNSVKKKLHFEQISYAYRHFWIN